MKKILSICAGAILILVGLGVLLTGDFVISGSVTLASGLLVMILGFVENRRTKEPDLN